jgi:hypothetical protein
MYCLLMIILKGHEYIFLEINMIFLVSLRSLMISWKIKLVGRLRY